MTFEYLGTITKEAIKKAKESIVMLKWDSPKLKRIIIERICPNCHKNLFLADQWFDQEQIVVLKRLCVKCRKTYILTGFLKDYIKSKAYFISLFRVDMHNKKLKNGMIYKN